MPLSPPEGPTQSKWRISARSAEMVGDYFVAFDIDATTDNPDDLKVPVIIQKFVDLINSSDDFLLNQGTRTYTLTEVITPTP